MTVKIRNVGRIDIGRFRSSDVEYRRTYGRDPHAPKLPVFMRRTTAIFRHAVLDGIIRRKGLLAAAPKKGAGTTLSPDRGAVLNFLRAVSRPNIDNLTVAAPRWGVGWHMLVRQLRRCSMEEFMRRAPELIDRGLVRAVLLGSPRSDLEALRIYAGRIASAAQRYPHVARLLDEIGRNYFGSERPVSKAEMIRTLLSTSRIGEIGRIIREEGLWDI